MHHNSWKITSFAWLSWNAINLCVFFLLFFEWLQTIVACHSHVLIGEQPLDILYTWIERKAYFTCWCVTSKTQEHPTATCLTEENLNRKNYAMWVFVLCQKQFEPNNSIWRTKRQRPTKMSDTDEMYYSTKVNERESYQTPKIINKITVSSIELHVIENYSQSIQVCLEDAKYWLGG